jgi:hypothetical protein
MFNSSHWEVNIVLTKDGICTLIDIVITDPTWMDLFCRSCTTQGFVAYNAFQTKEHNYCDWHPIYQFLPLPMEVFGCLHKHVDLFLPNCANAIWSLKGLEGFPLFILVTFLQQKNSITFQRLQTPSILSQVVAISLRTSRLPPLQDTSPISTIDLFQVVNFWYGKIRLTYCKRSIFDMDRFWHLVWTNLTSYKFSPPFF